MNSFAEMMENAWKAGGNPDWRASSGAMHDAGKDHYKPGRFTVKVTFDDNDYLVSTVNGSKSEIYQYYMGKSFTKSDETSHKVTRVDFV
jgi:hypothetical protein